MSVIETTKEIEVNEVAESYIRNMPLSESVTDWERTLIAGNIRGFWDSVKRQNYRAIQGMRGVLEGYKRVYSSLESEANCCGDMDAKNNAFVRWQESITMLCHLEEIEKDVFSKVDYNNWVGVKDAMPEVDVEVLVYGLDQQRYELRGVATYAGDRGWMMCEMSNLKEVTHWMLLPPNPR